MIIEGFPAARWTQRSFDDRFPGSQPLRSLRILGLLGVLAVLASGCSEEPQSVATSSQAPAVEVANPLSRDVNEWDQLTGRMEALQRVEVRARVSGYLQSVHFEEGSRVEKGDLLFVIDPRPYQAALDEAKAQVTRAEVRLQLAENDLDRAERLFARRAISEEEFDARTQEKREATAALEAAKAAVSAAQLDVDFTRVHAPISGRISEGFVDVGNLIRGGSADSTLLTTIVSMDPIHFYFDADEQMVLRYMRSTRAGTRQSSRDHPTPVKLQLSDEDGYPREGFIDFVDNRIDEATGTLRVRARFENPGEMLVPGMFAKLRVRGRGPYRALLLPDRALIQDQAVHFVYAVNADGVAERRTVEIGPKIRGLRVVRSGLEASDRVVVSGLQRVRPGSEVTPEQVELELGEAASGDGATLATEEGAAS